MKMNLLRELFHLKPKCENCGTVVTGKICHMTIWDGHKETIMNVCEKCEREMGRPLYFDDGTGGDYPEGPR